MRRCRVALALAALLCAPSARGADEPKSVTIKAEGALFFYCYWSVAFSPDGKLLAAGTRGDGIELRDPTTGKKLATLEGETWTDALVFSPDGKTLAAGGGYKGVIRLWDVPTRKAKVVLEDKAGLLECLAFSPDGKKLVASNSKKMVRIWDVMAGEVAVKFALEEEWATVLAFTPDGTKLAIGTAEGTVHLADVASGKVVAKLAPPKGFVNTLWEAFGGTHWVGAIAISPDGKELLAAGRGGRIRRWNLTTGTSDTIVLDHEGYNGLAFSPDRRLLAGGDRKGAVTVWDVATGKRLSRIEDRAGLYQLAFSPDGKTLACCKEVTVIFGGADPTPGKTVRLYPINLPAKK